MSTVIIRMHWSSYQIVNVQQTYMTVCCRRYLVLIQPGLVSDRSSSSLGHQTASSSLVGLLKYQLVIRVIEPMMSDH